MNKMVGAAEFEAHCARIMGDAAQSGETVAITRDGKPYMELKPVQPKLVRKGATFGFLAHPAYRFDVEPEESAYDGPWNAELDNDKDDPGTGQ